ncbi:Gfo/Idh/MocA family oxidoreductase [Actinomyces viscosus]|uniref:Glucose--fructose oxidoreductase n=2 Tax=Actinomyces viscosus TaxID=1656 RepID=A0A448PHF2_ACTVI|nr:Gfo/Idh/MocA family oxidoreductase [Actinomyces viscosus]VEI14350.1 Glucose--fructose oxidoreductase precursor [Actinomyces viscosus]
MSEPSRSIRSMSTAPRTGDTEDADDAPVRFGVIGAGFIAGWFAEAVSREPAARIVAVTSARRERAAAFAEEHAVPHAHASLEEMLAAHGSGSEAPIDVVYVGSPNSLHASQTITALEAGFHVLVEKPFALTLAQAEAMVEAAGRADRFLMEGWLSAFEPGVARVRETLPRLGRLHRVLLSKEQFSSRMETYRAGSLPPAFDPALGGGSLMDLGIYPVNLAIHLFGEPDRVTATGELLDSGADVRGTVILSYDSGEHAGLEVVCLHSKTSPGTKSTFTSDRDVLSIDDCQWPRRIELRGPAATRSSDEGVRAREDLSVERSAQLPGHQLAYELAEVCRLVRAGARESELHPLGHSVAAVRVLEEARRQVGVRFPADERH